MSKDLVDHVSSEVQRLDQIINQKDQEISTLENQIKQYKLQIVNLMEANFKFIEQNKQLNVELSSISSKNEAKSDVGMEKQLQLAQKEILNLKDKAKGDHMKIKNQQQLID